MQAKYNLFVTTLYTKDYANKTLGQVAHIYKNWKSDASLFLANDQNDNRVSFHTHVTGAMVVVNHFTELGEYKTLAQFDRQEQKATLHTDNKLLQDIALIFINPFRT